jgi:aspartyl-tRNA(Asn)/glutamyl-tRNA(Gln) amidotransferase subunit A
MKLNQLTIKQASETLARGEITSVDLTRACLARIKEVDGKIKACLTVCEREALAEAKAADVRRAKGETGPSASSGQASLLGIPYLAKDNIMTAGIRTTAASKILENYIAPYDATIIKKLRQAGAVLLGKTNLDEFAHGSSTENSAFGPTHNPWDLERVPGGSSGGSAAAVAADMCLFALGTDTGGSIRQPASFCGVVGLKPTYGRSSRFGLVAMTSSTDVPGPLTKTIEDAGLALSVMAGKDEYDATTVGEKFFPSSFERGIKGVCIGLPKEYFIEGTDRGVTQAIEKAIEKLKELGARFKKISLPMAKYGASVYYIITPAELSSNLARHDGIKYGLNVPGGKADGLMEIYIKSRGQGFGAEAKRRIMLGTYVLSAGYYDAYYLKAQKVRTEIKQEMDKALEQVDCLLTPTSPHVAFKIGGRAQDPLKMYLEDIFTIGVNLAGLPAVSLPCGFDNGLPVGLQLIGKRFDEATLLQISHCYEQATGWYKQKPKL